MAVQPLYSDLLRLVPVVIANSSQFQNRSLLSDDLLRFSAQAKPVLQGDVLPVIWEALGGVEEIPLVTVGLLLAFICQADFDATAAFVFWLLDK